MKHNELASSAYKHLHYSLTHDIYVDPDILSQYPSPDQVKYNVQKTKEDFLCLKRFEWASEDFNHFCNQIVNQIVIFSSSNLFLAMIGLRALNALIACRKWSIV